MLSLLVLVADEFLLEKLVFRLDGGAEKRPADLVERFLPDLVGHMGGGVSDGFRQPFLLKIGCETGVGDHLVVVRVQGVVGPVADEVDLLHEIETALQ